ncbi:hypothetical protein J5N97_029944 [Dioscorea zingiberensis]|uniref:Uncharacterized protein n=1 Tax=Dioscorea zingiberensis TaxID=325984 RepID=A0A9D5H3S8_9LILI|nr:hypothetical protein J5N97_029944 [Dioscorea zingiberensis]
MGRAPCCAKVGLRRGPWTAREDALLTKYIQGHGEGQWKSIPNKAAGRLPGRTDNEIKNYWNSHLSKKLKEKGFTTKQGMAKVGRCSSQRRNNNSNNNNNGNNDNSTDHGNGEKRKDDLKASEVYIPKPSRFSGIIRIPPEGSRKNDNVNETTLISELEEDRSNNSGMLYLNIPGFVQDCGFLFDQFAINELSPILDLHERLYSEYLHALNTEDDLVPMNSFADSLFA